MVLCKRVLWVKCESVQRDLLLGTHLRSSSTPNARPRRSVAEVPENKDLSAPDRIIFTPDKSGEDPQSIRPAAARRMEAAEVVGRQLSTEFGRISLEKPGIVGNPLIKGG